MNNLKRVLGVSLISAALTACADRQQISPVSESSPTASQPQSSNSVDPNDQSFAPPKSDCDERQCEKAELNIQLVDLATGTTVSELTGYTNQRVGWGAKVETRDPGRVRNLLIRLENIPEGVDVTLRGNTAVAIGSFFDETSGTFDIRARDVDYCKRRNNNSSECDDMTRELREFDQVQPASYSITQDPQQQAEAQAARQQQQQQSQAATLNCVTGLFSAFTGNIAGAAGCIGAVTGGLGRN